MKFNLETDDIGAIGGLSFKVSDHAEHCQRGWPTSFSAGGRGGCLKVDWRFEGSLGLEMALGLEGWKRWHFAAIDKTHWRSTILSKTCTAHFLSLWVLKWHWTSFDGVQPWHANQCESHKAILVQTFKPTVIEPFSECFPNSCQSAVMMMHFLSLSVMLVLTSGCDFKDVECLDEKQVLFQLRTDVHDSTEYLDSHRGLGAVAQDPRSRHWRRRDRRYHPYGPPLRQCQCQYNQYKHHNQQYKQHKQQYKQHNQYQHRDHSIMHCNRIAVWSWQFHESCSSRKWKYNSFAGIPGPNCRLLRWFTGERHGTNQCSRGDIWHLGCFLGNSHRAIRATWFCGWWPWIWRLSSSSGIVFVIAGDSRCLETHFSWFCGCCKLCPSIKSSVDSEWAVCMTDLAMPRTIVKRWVLQPHVEKLWAEVLVEAKQHLWSFAQTCEATKPFGLVSGVLMHNSKKHTSFERDLWYESKSTICEDQKGMAPSSASRALEICFPRWKLDLDFHPFLASIKLAIGCAVDRQRWNIHRLVTQHLW